MRPEKLVVTIRTVSSSGAMQVKLRTLPPIRPNAGTEARYRAKLQALIRKMADSVEYWVKASYNQNEPVIAQDELPATALKKAVDELRKRWQKQFDEAAPALARYFAIKAEKRVTSILEGILREGGFSVKFKMTRAMQDAMNASIAEQVGLIKSIPSQYFTQIEGMVMRSVQAGRDIFPLTQQLQEQFGVTKRRAALIARDQNNKATATITRVRQTEMGISRAIWLHSHGGKTPRPTHLKNNGKPYDIAKGWYDPDEGRYIFPGELINCRCVSKPIVEGFS